MSFLRQVPALAFLTALSRAMGLVRNMLMARAFGTSLLHSAFVVAFRIPNLFRRLFGEGALTSAFIPVFTDTLVQKGERVAWRLAWSVLTFTGCLLGIITVAVLLGVSIMAGFAPEGGRLATILHLLQIVFPYMWFICLAALSMGVLNAFRRYALAATTSLVLNGVWIFFLLFVCRWFGDTPEAQMEGVVWGILLAGALQLIIQIPSMRRCGMPYRPAFAWRMPEARRVLKLAVPATIGAGVIQFNLLLDSLLAMLAADWAPSALSFAELVVYLPLGVFATALGTVLLPTLSREVAQGAVSQAKHTFKISITTVLCAMLPAAAGLVALAEPIVRFLYQTGEFDAVSTLRTARALRFYALGLVVFGIQKMMAPMFHAHHDTRTPMRVGLKAIGINLTLNVLSVLYLPIEYRHAGIALSTVIAACVNVVALGRILSRRFGSFEWRMIGADALRIAAASGIMLAAAMLTAQGMEEYFDGRGLSARAISGRVVVAAIAVGIGVYALAFRSVCPRLWNLLKTGLARGPRRSRPGAGSAAPES